MARNETEARRYKTLAMVKLEQQSYASALSYLKKARRNYNKFDALDNLEAVIPIKKAYRKIILLVHPNKCLEFPHAATSATERLNDAYNTLLDADAKEEYDRNVPTTRTATGGGIAGWNTAPSDVKARQYWRRRYGRVGQWVEWYGSFIVRLDMGSGWEGYVSILNGLTGKYFKRLKMDKWILAYIMLRSLCLKLEAGYLEGFLMEECLIPKG
ncbi:transcription factor, MADS-box [Tanacetum coccineum]